MATGNVEIDGILWRCSCPPAAAKSRGSSRNRKMWQEPLQPSFLGFSRLCTRNDMPILPAQLSLHYSDPCYTLLNRRLTLQSWTRTAPLWRPTFERLAAAISNWLIQCLPSLLRMWLIISPVDVAALCPAWSRSEPVRKYDQPCFSFIYIYMRVRILYRFSNHYLLYQYLSLAIFDDKDAFYPRTLPHVKYELCCHSNSLVTFIFKWSQSIQTLYKFIWQTYH